jgi:hypothetical protein
MNEREGLPHRQPDAQDQCPHQPFTPEINISTDELIRQTKEWVLQSAETPEQARKLIFDFRRGSLGLTNPSSNIEAIREAIEKAMVEPLPTEDTAENQERLWREEPYNAFLNTAVEIINRRIITTQGGRPLTPVDINDDPSFEFSANFIDKTSKNKEKWRLIIDYKKTGENKHQRRIAIRNLSEGRSRRLGYTRDLHRGYSSKESTLGIAVLDDDEIRSYNSEINYKSPLRTIFGLKTGRNWDEINTSYNENKEKEISLLRQYLDPCLKHPDLVGLYGWESILLRDHINKTIKDYPPESPPMVT